MRSENGNGEGVSLAENCWIGLLAWFSTQGMYRMGSMDCLDFLVQPGRKEQDRMRACIAHCLGT